MRTWAIAGLSLVVTSCGGGGASGPGGGGEQATDSGPLMLSNWSAPSAATTGDAFEVSYRLTNRSSEPQGASVVVALAPREPFGLTDLVLDTWFDLGGLQGGEARDLSSRVQIPDQVATGRYAIGAFVGVSATEIGHSVGSSIDVEGVFCEDDAFEDDDSLEEARSIALMQEQTHNFCRDVDDWMAFEAEAGGHYFFERRGREPQLELYSPGGERLATNLPGAPSRSLGDYWQAPTEGTHYLRAFRPLGLSSAGQDTEFSLVVRDERVELSFERAFALDAVRTAGAPLTLGFNLRAEGALPIAEVDVAVVLSEDDVIDASDLESFRITLSDADVDYEGTSSREFREEVTWSIPASTPPGSYRMGVVVDPDDAWPEYLETDNAALVGTLTVEAPACAPDLTEEDDFVAQASALDGIGQTSANLCDDGSDWYELRLSAGDELRLATVAEMGAALLSLYDGAGARVGAGAAAGPVEWTVERDGTYYALVGSQTFDGQGGFSPTGARYTLLWREAGPDLVIADATLVDGDFNTFFGGDVELALRNDGGDDIGGFTIVAYLSDDAVLDASDTPAGESASPQVSFPWVPGSFNELTRSVRVDPGSAPPGDYYVIVEVVLTDGGIDRGAGNHVVALPATLVEF